MARGTTMMTGSRFMSMSRSKRPATSGNKRVRTGKGGQSTGPAQKSRVAGVFSSTHTGPYLGRKSV